MKLIAPKIEDAPAKWREKLVRSIAPVCARLPARGGYTGRPVPVSASTMDVVRVEMMVVIGRSLYYLFREMLYQVL